MVITIPVPSLLILLHYAYVASYVCMNACIYVAMYACTYSYVCMHACIYVCTCICIT